MKLKNGFDTDDLIGRQNREDEEGQAPASFTLRESPRSILELVGMGVIMLAIGVFLLLSPNVQNGETVGWLATVIGGACMILVIPLALYRVRVDGDGLKIGYGPVTTKSILWEEVRYVKVVLLGEGAVGASSPIGSSRKWDSTETAGAFSTKVRSREALPTWFAPSWSGSFPPRWWSPYPCGIN